MVTRVSQQMLQRTIGSACLQSIASAELSQYANCLHVATINSIDSQSMLVNHVRIAGAFGCTQHSVGSAVGSNHQLDPLSAFL